MKALKWKSSTPSPPAPTRQWQSGMMRNFGQTGSYYRRSNCELSVQYNWVYRQSYASKKWSSARLTYYWKHRYLCACRQFNSRHLTTAYNRPCGLQRLFDKSLWYSISSRRPTQSDNNASSFETTGCDRFTLCRTTGTPSLSSRCLRRKACS